VTFSDILRAEAAFLRMSVMDRYGIPQNIFFCFLLQFGVRQAELLISCPTHLLLTWSSAVADRLRYCASRWNLEMYLRGHSRSLQMAPFDRRLSILCPWNLG